MERHEELKHPSQRLSDDELLFRLRHIASGRCGTAGTVDSALDYAVADGTLSRERANALRQALVDEGVIDDLRTIAERKSTMSRANDRTHPEYRYGVDSAEHPRTANANQRCKDCGYGVDSRSHFIQCHPLKTTAPVQNVNTPQPGPILSDTEALDLIAREMSAYEWSADTLDVIAAYLRASGREIEDSNIDSADDTEVQG